MILTDGYISGGYMILLPAQREEWMDQELLPRTLISASGCICETIPDVWALSTSKESWKERKQIAAPFGVPARKVRRLISWVTTEWGENRLIWPDRFCSADSASEFAGMFIPDPSELVLLGIGLRDGRVEDFLSGVCEQDMGWTEVPGWLREHHRMDANGNALGFEVLGFEPDVFHSWVCNGLEKSAGRELGIVLNEYGLIPREDEAEKIAALCDADDGTEPVWWDPWLLVRYKW